MDDVHALFAQASLQDAPEEGLLINCAGIGLGRFDVEIDVAATLAVVYPRAEEPDAGAGAEGVAGDLTDDVICSGLRRMGSFHPMFKIVGSAGAAVEGMPQSDEAASQILSVPQCLISWPASDGRVGSAMG